MSDFTAAFEIISKNSSDIEDMISKIGGVPGFLGILPDLIRIVDTLSTTSTPAATVPDVVQYSAQTKAAVEGFQKKYNLTVDGYVGNETWAKIQSLIN